MPFVIDKKNVFVKPRQVETPLSFLHHDTSKEWAFPYLFPKVKFGYSVRRDKPVSVFQYFNQRLLSFNQNFAFDPDNIFFWQVCLWAVSSAFTNEIPNAYSQSGPTNSRDNQTKLQRH